MYQKKLVIKYILIQNFNVFALPHSSSSSLMKSLNASDLQRVCGSGGAQHRLDDHDALFSDDDFATLDDDEFDKQSVISLISLHVASSAQPAASGKRVGFSAAPPVVRTHAAAMNNEDALSSSSSSSLYSRKISQTNQKVVETVKKKTKKKKGELCNFLNYFF